MQFRKYSPTNGDLLWVAAGEIERQGDNVLGCTGLNCTRLQEARKIHGNLWLCFLRLVNGQVKSLAGFVSGRTVQPGPVRLTLRELYGKETYQIISLLLFFVVRPDDAGLSRPGFNFSSYVNFESHSGFLPYFSLTPSLLLLLCDSFSTPIVRPCCCMLLILAGIASTCALDCTAHVVLRVMRDLEHSNAHRKRI